MRLLNTKTFRVAEFFTIIPPYAILSHTWGHDEVTFQDIQSLEVAMAKGGWSKVEKACIYARRYKFDWIWIDTCCIDKSSSAELSEALNSMYRYYGDGRICITYLSDVRGDRAVEELKKSRWFQRGWTLQELLAPRYVVFLDQDWEEVGTRWSLRHTISQITSIPVRALETRNFEDYSIAQKMSWAASRLTTREEDIAYCLIGIFGVNMIPIYGEGGEKAFMRLQQEIIRISDDRSIFAWVATPDYDQDRGLFARSPAEFALSGQVGISSLDDIGDKSSISFHNNGIRIYLPLWHQPDLGEDVFLASLHCPEGTNDGYVGIYLQKEGARYIRWCSHLPLPITNKSSSLFDIELQEVSVREPTRWQYTTKYTTETPIEFRLSDHRITYVDRSIQPLNLNYTTTQAFRKGNESFNITLVPGINDVIPVVHASFDRSSDFSSSYQDCDLLPIENGSALISCSVHVTGDSMRTMLVKVDYIPGNTPKFELYRQLKEIEQQADKVVGNFGSQTANLVVENFGDIESEPREIFHPKWEIPHSHDRQYIALSNPGFGDPHCVLKYEMSQGSIFIALGLHSKEEQEEQGTKSKGLVTWIDVTVLDKELQIPDVWKSYLPSGSRHKRRTGGRVSDESDWCRATATVKQKSTLQSNLYHVSVNAHIREHVSPQMEFPGSEGRRLGYDLEPDSESGENEEPQNS